MLDDIFLDIYARRMKTGKVIISDNSLVEDHELKVGHILARTGSDVIFLPVGAGKSPDIKYNGRIWEIKSPVGSKRRTLENNMRKAMTQSENIIMDLRRIKINEDTCLREIRRQVELSGKRIRRLIAINKREEIIRIK